MIEQLKKLYSDLDNEIWDQGATCNIEKNLKIQDSISCVLQHLLSEVDFQKWEDEVSASNGNFS